MLLFKLQEYIYIKHMVSSFKANRLLSKFAGHIQSGDLESPSGLQALGGSDCIPEAPTQHCRWATGRIWPSGDINISEWNQSDEGCACIITFISYLHKSYMNRYKCYTEDKS